MTISNKELIEKYHDIIAEEVNVKQVGLLNDDLKVTITYIPLGQQLSSKFGKDTGMIISAAKAGKVHLLEQGRIEVISGDNSRILERNDYEVRYQGLNDTNQTVEEEVIVSLDLTLTDELKAEGIAREISRFLNQLRKEADYQVDDRVICYRESADEELSTIIANFSSFLQQEALLSQIISGVESSDLWKEFEIDGKTAMFGLKK